MIPYLVSKYGDRVAATTLEVLINNTTGEYTFPDNSILREKRTLGLGIASNPDDTSVSATGRPLVSDDALESSYLYLRSFNDTVIEEVPLSFFMQGLNAPEFKVFELTELNPLKSKIRVGDTSLITSGESILLTFLYLM